MAHDETEGLRSLADIGDHPSIKDIADEYRRALNEMVITTIEVRRDCRAGDNTCLAHSGNDEAEVLMNFDLLGDTFDSETLKMLLSWALVRLANHREADALGSI